MYSATGLTADTQHIIGTRTVDTIGNVNASWVNHTARTAPVAPVAPVALFSGKPTTGTVPLSVQFTDESTGEITGYSWDFGDGATSTEQSPSHEYAMVGTYDVQLVVTGSGGSDDEVKTDYITVQADTDNDSIPDKEEQGPGGTDPAYDGNGDGTSDSQQGDVASFHTTTGDYVTLVSLEGMYLTDVQAVDNPSPTDTPEYLETPFGFIGFTITGLAPEGGAVTVQLYLPTGTTVNTYYKYGMTPDNAIPHWYEFLFDGTTGAEISENIITLHFVDGNRGDNDCIANGIIIDPSGPGNDIRLPPTAAFSADPTSGTAPLTVTFTDASTGTGPLTYVWDFGDGATSTEQSPDHEYTADGTYDVQLTVTGPGGSDDETKTGYITVGTVYPSLKAEFTANPRKGAAPLTVTFTDESRGMITQRSWKYKLHSDSRWTPFTLDAASSYTFKKAGTYDVQSTVTGPGGSDDETKIGYITVGAVTPSPVADFTATPRKGAAPLTVTFTDESSGMITQRSWKYKLHSDSKWTPFTLDRSSSYTFKKAGTYDVQLTVTGPRGSDDEIKTGYITVGAVTPSPVADFRATPRKGAAPLTVTFTDESSGMITQRSWKYKLHSDSKWTPFTLDRSSSYTFKKAGTYDVQLTVTGPRGSDDETKIGYITVGAVTPSPVADFRATPRKGAAPLTVTFTDESSGMITQRSWKYKLHSDSKWTPFTLDAVSSNTFKKAGTYDVQLTVTGPGGSDDEIKAGYITVGTVSPTQKV